ELSVRPTEWATTLTAPALTPVTTSVATPATVALGAARLSEPASPAGSERESGAEGTGAELVAASWMVAVTVRVAPETRSVVAPEMATGSAAPCTTVKLSAEESVRPTEWATTLTAPALTPVTTSVATPATVALGAARLSEPASPAG